MDQRQCFNAPQHRTYRFGNREKLRVTVFDSLIISVLFLSRPSGASVNKLIFVLFMTSGYRLEVLMLYHEPERYHLISQRTVLCSAFSFQDLSFVRNFMANLG